MDNKKSSDEQPKRKIAERVVTPKRKYFVPALGETVEATDAETAVEEARKAVKKREAGDAEQ